MRFSEKKRLMGLMYSKEDSELRCSKFSIECFNTSFTRRVIFPLNIKGDV
jgi:hypothetical protein